MPPKGSGTLLEKDFIYSKDKTKAQCKMCTVGIPEEARPWIDAASAAKHLQRPSHKKAVEQLKQADVDYQAQRAAAAAEQAAAAAAPIFPVLKLATPQNLSGPIRDQAAWEPSAQEAQMWADYHEHGAAFSAGDSDAEKKRQADRARLERAAEVFGILNAEAVAHRLGMAGDNIADEVLAQDEEQDYLGRLLRDAGLDAPDAGEIQAHLDGTKQPDPSSQWFPYPSQTMFLLDLLDNLPRLRVSSSLMRVFMWVLKQSGCKNVPSFDSLRKFQKELRSESGVPSIPCVSPLGNVFFMNDPRSILAKDWANPEIRKHIRVYPEIPEDGVVREIWHGQKWRKMMDLDCLSPMYDAGGGVHYYVNELARLKDGRMVIPVRWVTCCSKVHTDAFLVTLDPEGAAVIEDGETIMIAASDLEHNFFDLKAEAKLPKWSEAAMRSKYPACMPNPKREIAGGEPLYYCFVNYFGDDVSGNRTRQFNKHWNAYITHLNLPRKLLMQEFHVHFVSTSQYATISEQYREFKEIVESTYAEPVRVEDGNGNGTRFCICTFAAPSDNSMQSEISSHIGGQGNKFCRKCEVGGPRADKEQNAGYHALFEAGTLRSKEKIIEAVEEQVKLACAGNATAVTEAQRDTGVKDAYTQHWIDFLLAQFNALKSLNPDRSEEDIKAELVQWTLDNRDKIYSAFLTTKGFDATKDTPVEILHTILLGLVKYVWHISHSKWSPAQKKTYALRLQTTETRALSIHAVRANYIMQYAGSLIGRQFKTLVQSNVFHMHGLVSDEKFLAWRAVGELGALFWFTEIRNMEEYLADLRVAVANMLDVCALIDPSKIITKIKYHLLTHTDDDVRAFGPLVGMATEIYESFNAVFRYCSILSNHLAPSRDIALQLGDQEGIKSRLTGGRWCCADGVWRRAGPGVRSFMDSHPILQKLLGWSNTKPLKHGSVKLKPVPRGSNARIQLKFKETSAARALNGGAHPGESKWDECKSVVSESGDECKLGTWVFASSATDPNATVIGRIEQILTQGATSCAVLEIFQALRQRDTLTGLPVLVRRDGETTFMVVPTEKVKFDFNVQHDCYTAKCEATGQRLRKQELVESDQIDFFIEHKLLDRYLINSHALHNAHLLRASLPRETIAPIPLFDNRKSKHDEFAAKLRAMQANRPPRKRKRTAKTKSKPTTAEEGDVPQAGGGDVEDETEERPRKRTRVRQKAKPRTPARSAAPALEGLIAGRAKRTVTKSRRAKDAEGQELDEDEDEDVDPPNDDSDDYGDSDDDSD
ncbi:hypothetical protein GGX14DRAFT_575340 [Mycena pura]|uniref:Uncharacterized protein n=1 Tax=Mycena pura TaxID=153505 RepID=A0AAD6UVF8_9AGAR|nr:hypothetical protein GGX14DRAFT_575340 [Mycena pura]